MLKERLKIASRGKDDLYFLAKEILGYDKMHPRPHRELCDFYEKSEKDVDLILMPRGSFKSSVITVAGSIQQMIKDPNIRILISSETQNKANKFVSEIKQHLEMNVKFRALYGEWQKAGNVWKGNEFTIAPRNRPKKEPTVMSGSLEKGTLTGYHYDYIVLDDVVSENNVNSTEQIEKTVEHFKLLLSILDPGGKIIVIGTRWAYYELYGWLLDPDSPVSEDVNSCVMQAVDDDGVPTMPKILSEEFLRKTKARQGSYIFTAQYLNRITAGDNNTFNAKHVHQYEETEEWKQKVGNTLIHFMTVDPAISLKSGSDFTGIVVNGVDYHGNWYIREAINERMEPSKLIDTLFKLNAAYQPMMCMAMEKFALEKMLKVSLTEEMEKRDEFFPIKDLETSNKVSKEVRIRALQPVIEAGKVHLKKEHKELFKQISEHPFGKYDDVLDALKSQIGIVFPSDMKPAEIKTGPNLTRNEQMVWSELDKLTRRKVRRTYEY